MDLAPFGRINPCGYPGLAVTDLSRASGVAQSPAELAHRLGRRLANALSGPQG